VTLRSACAHYESYQPYQSPQKFLVSSAFCGAMMSGTLLPMLQARAALETLETSLPVYQDARCYIQEVVVMDGCSCRFCKEIDVWCFFYFGN
jgi:hypothetical protein